MSILDKGPGSFLFFPERRGLKNVFEARVDGPLHHIKI